MSFVTGIVLPKVHCKDGQPFEIVDEQLKSVISQAAEGALHEVIEDYALMHSKRLRAKLVMDCGKVFGVKEKDLSAWAVAVELINNAVRIQEAIVISENSKSHFSGDEVQGFFESQQAASFFMALLPSIIAKVPMNDGLRTRLLCVGSSFYLNYLNALLSFSNTVPSESLATISPEIFQYVLKRAALLFELPVQGTALIAGLSPKESIRISEAFRFLGEIQFLIDEIIVLTEGPSKLIAEHSLPLFNLLLLGLRDVKGLPREKLLELDKEELVIQLKSTGVLRQHLEKIKTVQLQIEKSDMLKPWPKLFDLIRHYVLNFLRPVESFVKQI